MATTIVFTLAVPLFGSVSLPAEAAESCAQLNDRVFGRDGTGGLGSRFRRLKLQIDEERRLGQRAAAEKDGAEYKSLAAQIVADARSMKSANCKPRIVASGSVPSGATSESGTGEARFTRSAHGCVGFDGSWRTPAGTIHLRNGSGTYGATTLRGATSGNVLRGTWENATMALESLRHGTFTFTLASDGDSFTTVWTSADGVSGSYDTDTCVGP